MSGHLKEEEPFTDVLQGIVLYFFIHCVVCNFAHCLAAVSLPRAQLSCSLIY